MRISTHVHATEEVDKVKQALCTFLSVEACDLDVILKTLDTEGDAGNKISILQATVTKKRDIDAVLSKIGANLPDDHKRLLRDNFEKYFSAESRTLFIRFHKQALFQDQFRLSQFDDVVHVAIKFVSYVKSKSVEEDINQVQAELVDHGVLA
jgi:hypothetical protein